MQSLIASSLLVAAACPNTVLGAATNMYDRSAFSGTETVITFDDIGHQEPITDQYAAQGVTFTNLYGYHDDEDDTVRSGLLEDFSLSASSWKDTEGEAGCLPVLIDFQNPMGRVGFDATAAKYVDIDFTIQALVREKHSGNWVAVGYISPFHVGTVLNFFGFEDASGIDRIILSLDLGEECVWMNDLRFERLSVSCEDNVDGINAFFCNDESTYSQCLGKELVVDAQPVSAGTTCQCESMLTVSSPFGTDTSAAMCEPLPEPLANPNECYIPEWSSSSCVMSTVSSVCNRGWSVFSTDAKCMTASFPWIPQGSPECQTVPSSVLAYKCDSPSTFIMCAGNTAVAGGPFPVPQGTTCECNQFTTDSPFSGADDASESLCTPI